MGKEYSIGDSKKIHNIIPDSYRRETVIELAELRVKVSPLLVKSYLIHCVIE